MKERVCFGSCSVLQPSVRGSLSVYCGRAWARLACNLQTSVSQAILNRVGGVGVFDDLAEDASEH